MHLHRRSSDAKARADWMVAYEAAVVKARPEWAGRFNWDAANHFYNCGYDPQSAADKYVASGDVRPHAFLHQP